MSREERRERIRRMVDDWPPFTPEQQARLRVLLRPEPAAEDSADPLTPRAGRPAA